MARQSPESGASGLRIKLTWITAFRTIASVVLLATLAVRLVSQAREGGPTPVDYASFLTIGVVFVTTLANALLLRSGRVGRGAAWAQVVADVLFASAFVALTGGPESPFLFVYSIAIIAASVLLERLGSLVAAAASSVSYLGIVGWMQAASLVSARSGSHFVLEAGTQVAAQLLIAVLSGYLADQLSRTGGQLSERELDLEKLQSLQTEIVTSIPSGLLTADGQGVITYANPAAEAILDEPGGLLGRPVEALIPNVLSARTGRRLETMAATRAGKRSLGLSITPLVGQPGYLLVFQDLTELRRMQVELSQIDHLASLGRTMATLAHEVKNPLAAVRGSAQLLATEQPAGTPGERLTQLIVRESDRLVELLDSYLALARPAAPVRGPTALDRLAAETIEMLRNDPEVANRVIEEQLAPATASVDPGQVKQVLINLLRNACAAVQAGGRVRVTVAPSAAGVTLEVWDSAGALAAEDLDRVFQPFYTTKQGGTGLGLSTSRSIVLAHGGAIEVSSSAQSGTSFVVRLPAEPSGGA